MSQRRLHRPRRLEQMSLDQQKYLAAYFLLCKASHPSEIQELPDKELAPALTQLSHLAGAAMYRSRWVEQGYRGPSNHTRKVVARKGIGQLAS